MIRDLILSAAESRKWWLAGGIHPSQVVAAYQPKGAESLAASYVNLAQPGTNNAAPGVAPTLGTDGWAFNGVNQYLLTGIVPSSTTGVFVRIKDQDSSVTYTCSACGCDNGSSKRIWVKLSTTGVAYRSAYPITLSTEIISNGVCAITPSAAYLDGIKKGTLGAWITGVTAQIGIGGTYNGSGNSSFLKGKIVAMMITTGSITDAQVAALSSAMAAL